MSIIIIEYDRNEISYKDLIYDMALRNNFYKDDVFSNLHNFKKVSPLQMKIINCISNNKEKKNFMFRNILTDLKMKQEENIVKGFISYDENKNMIGFLLYNEKTQNPMEKELTFILVDKPYQYNGVGNMLMNHFILLMNKYPTAIQVRVEHKKQLLNWYSKMGFITCDECQRKYPLFGLIEKDKNFTRMIYITERLECIYNLTNIIMKNQSLKNEFIKEAGSLVKISPPEYIHFPK